MIWGIVKIDQLTSTANRADKTFSFGKARLTN